MTISDYRLITHEKTKRTSDRKNKVDFKENDPRITSTREPAHNLESAFNHEHLKEKNSQQVHAANPKRPAHSDLNFMRNMKPNESLARIEEQGNEIFNLNMVIESLNTKLAQKDGLIAAQINEFQNLSRELNRYERDQVNLLTKLELYEKTSKYL